MSRPAWDAVVIGGGFFGCCLALTLRTACDRVLLLERETTVLTRASRVNQARVHTGFHYPRSMVTARRSRALQARFVAAFPQAIVSDFRMLYAVARHRSKVTASRFSALFRALDAPFTEASRTDAALFDSDHIEAVYACQEFAFDWRALRESLAQRLDAAGVFVRTGLEARQVTNRENGIRIETVDEDFNADAVFNVTYAGLNDLALTSGLQGLRIKHEWAEVALVTPPPDLAGHAVTVMDGPFFSTMPYPAEGLHSPTHVRYTPHAAWTDDRLGPTRSIAEAMPRRSRAREMIVDAARYLPCMIEARHERSLWEVKTVRTQNEIDDARPILIHRHADCPRMVSILGAKLDNVFDLLEALPAIDTRWRDVRPEAVFA
ncbi:FAD-dependent oxidoreductase [Brevundimonas bacteroides]|uniref:FAD-dependent oxidoreductase n=1 Tax=Brevundimonas bacteroides TaxID=74311 RepID=UPI000A015BA6|nr:FAD-dependent oxidoreductase [Brevundimonas bacteroides]